MREESHLDDMRSAIRGDFERLAERRGGQELMSVDDVTPERDLVERADEPESGPAPEPEPPAEAVGPKRATDQTSEAVSDAEPEPDRDPELGLGDAVEGERPASWLDRLLGR